MKVDKGDVVKKLFGDGVELINKDLLNFEITNCQVFEEPNILGDDVTLAGKVLRNLHWVNDIQYMGDWSGAKPCLAFEHDNPPIIHLKNDDFDVVLTAKVLHDVLVMFAKANNSMTCHAAQLGLNYDVFVVYDYFEEQFISFFNTIITEVDNKTVVSGKEYSLTYPGLIIEVERPKACELAYLDLNGEIRRERWGEYSARLIFQNYFFSRGIPFWQQAKEEELKVAIGKRELSLIADDIFWEETDLV